MQKIYYLLAITLSLTVLRCSYPTALQKTADKTEVGVVNKTDIGVFVKTTLENFNRLNLIDDDAVASYDKIAAGFARFPEESLECKSVSDIAGMILTDFAYGEINIDDGTYISSQDKIYVFDVEIFPTNRMYARFIDGIETIITDDVQFANVTEDTSGVDWKSGTGEWILRFECNGKPYEFAAEMNNDWFDTDIIGFMNAVLKDQGIEKRLLVTDDGMQECILFYNDNKWAGEYERIMGYALECPMY